jgi:hypothetical protein
LTLAVDDALDDFCFSKASSSASRCGRAWPSRATGGFAKAVLEIIERDFDFVAGLDLEFAAFVLELARGDDRFGLEAGVDDDGIVPGLMRWLARLCSNSSAKFSVICYTPA